MKIISVNVATPLPMEFQGQEVQTGIFKKSIGDQTVFLDHVNIAGDRQADLVNHGGVDKAVLMYPYEHYAYWEQKLNRELPMGAFGENITIEGITEKEVCIGDIFQLGDAVVQVSQPRKPCYKLAARWGVDDMVLQVQENGFSGFYFRVLQPGNFSVQSDFEQIGQHPLRISAAFASYVLFHDRTNQDALEHILQLGDVLAEAWRSVFQQRYEELQKN